MKPKAIILFAPGTNRDSDVCQALELAGACTEVVPLSLLRDRLIRLADYQIMVIPGGFSYADALGAGKLLALDLKEYFAEEIGRFVQQGKPVLGICNGFQALVKSGILPDVPSIEAPQATLTFNDSGHFECRWVTLAPVSQTCIWTRALEEPIFCPIAHGEGKFVPAAQNILEQMRMGDQIALTYCNEDGSPAQGRYPVNPNGSVLDIAGISNPQGNVLGLMPHPENHVLFHQHPRRTRGERNGSGLPLFVNGVRYAAEM